MSLPFGSRFVQGQRLRYQYLEAGTSDSVVLLLPRSPFLHHFPGLYYFLKLVNRSHGY